MIEFHSLVDAGDVVLAIGDRAVLLRKGRLSAATFIVGGNIPSAVSQLRRTARDFPGPAISAEARAEMSVVAGWLARNAADVRILRASGCWVSPARAKPCANFEPRATKS